MINPEILIHKDQKGSNEVAFLHRLRRQIKYQKTQYETIWFMIKAMLLGRHDIEYDAALGQWFINDKSPPWKVQVSINRMLAMYLREHARLTTGLPYFDVMPASSDTRDRYIAKVSESLLNYLWLYLDMGKKTDNLVAWALQTGTGIWKIEWDADEGHEILIPQREEIYENDVAYDNMGNIIFDPITGAPTYEMKRVGSEIVYDKDGLPKYEEHLHIGDIRITDVSPFDFFVDDRYSNLQDAPHVCHYYLTRIEDLREKYEEAKDITPSRNIPQEKLYSERLRNLVSSFGSKNLVAGMPGVDDVAIDENNEGLVLLWEIWRKPNKKKKDGEVLIICEDKVLYKGRNPYKHRKYPFVVFKEISFPDRFWGVPIQEHLVSVQKTYSESRSLEIQDAIFTANPMIITYTAGRVQKSDLTRSPNSIIDCYAPGYEPKYFQHRPVESILHKNVQNSALMDMDELASQHEVSRGAAPGRLDSSLALSWLSSKDEQSVMPKVVRLNKTREEAAEMFLSLYNQFVNEKRLIKITGEGMEAEVIEFSGDDLEGDDPFKNYYDIRIRPSSTRPINRAAQKNEIIQYIQMGILNPVTQGKYIARMLDIGDSKDFYLEDRLNEARAKKEIEALKRGNRVAVMSYENHQIHIDVFVKFMLTNEFYEMDESIKQLFVEHLDKHNAMYEQSLTASLQQNVAISGSNKGKEGEKQVISEMPQTNQKKQDLEKLYGT